MGYLTLSTHYGRPNTHQRVTTTCWWAILPFPHTTADLTPTNESRQLVGGLSYPLHPLWQTQHPPTSHDDSLVGYLTLSTHYGGPNTHQRVTTTCWWAILPTTTAPTPTNESRRLVGGLSYPLHPLRRTQHPPMSHDDSLVGYLTLSTHYGGPNTHQRVMTTHW